MTLPVRKFMLWLLFALYVELNIGEEEFEEPAKEYCPYDSFGARCLNNEVILMKSATYGRMRIGRCITAAEIEALRSGNLGCSMDVLPLLDQKCSGKLECEMRVIDIASQNYRPCPPGLNVYLEASYDCLTVADEKRSCVVIASKNPTHITNSNVCGIKSQPWIIEAPVGQKVSITLLEFATLESIQFKEESCNNHGVIVDKAGKRNTSICRSGSRREKKLYMSVGNAIDILLNSDDRQGNNGNQYLLRLEAVGCSDLVPPEDAYVKRSGDAIVIGCYLSRKTWHLHCEEGKWIGVIGNCSQGSFVPKFSNSAVEPEATAPVLNNVQILIVVAVCGFTLTVCLAIVSLGVFCLRRYYAQDKKMQDYRTLNVNNCAGPRQLSQLIPVSPALVDFAGNDIHSFYSVQQNTIPTFPVSVGEDVFN